MASIYWIRKDLRVDDNPALQNAIENGANTALFYITPQTWARHQQAPIKTDLIERQINEFSNQLNQLGIRLVTFHVDNFTDCAHHLINYCQSNHINQVYANQELELDERDRDALVSEAIKLQLFEADVVLSKGSILNKQGEMFKVFTPFKRAWLKHILEFGFDDRYLAPELSSTLSEKNASNINFAAPKACSKKWPTASTILSQVVPQFIQHKMADYHAMRDIPSHKGTSGLSPYLAIGAISPKRLLREVLLQYPDLLLAHDTEQFTWLNEIIWREFYRHLLFHFPNLIKHQDFQQKFHGFHWPSHTEHFTLWCEGKTGYPIIDAAMRQLSQTGWMHNRLRMIVASFLTKHLLVDWRLGQAHFMTHLIDGDFAANNGGWQWAAGTGCDAQPYFRIFNPLTQSQKFDPSGDFIRKYLPELSQVPDKHIHFPHDYLAATGQSDVYWDAIVDLKAARQAALSYYATQLDNTK